MGPGNAFFVVSNITPPYLIVDFTSPKLPHSCVSKITPPFLDFKKVLILNKLFCGSISKQRGVLISAIKNYTIEVFHAEALWFVQYRKK